MLLFHSNISENYLVWLYTLCSSICTKPQFTRSWKPEEPKCTVWYTLENVAPSCTNLWIHLIELIETSKYKFILWKAII
nr:hypothetical protein Iba_chr12fCG7120 [Ipomoea batatas]